MGGPPTAWQLLPPRIVGYNPTLQPSISSRSDECAGTVHLAISCMCGHCRLLKVFLATVADATNDSC